MTKTPEQIVDQTVLHNYGPEGDLELFTEAKATTVNEELTSAELLDAAAWMRDLNGLGVYKLMVAAVEADRAQFPDGNWRPRFEPGERVEAVSGGYGGNPRTFRPGVVVAIDDEPRMHHYLRVRFDDGEERQINPDVMRRIRA